jgi:hypothetical protein
VIAALRVAARGMSDGSTSAAAAAAAGSSQPLVAMVCSAMQQQQQRGSATAEEPTEQQQQQGGGTAEEPTEQQQQLPKRLYSLLVSSLKGILLNISDTAGYIRLMLASVEAAKLVVHLCKAAARSGSSSSSSKGTLSVQQLCPWMALAARSVAAAIESHMRLSNDNNAAGLAEIISSNNADAVDKEIATNPDIVLEQLPPAVTWLVEQLQQHQHALGVPAELVAELQQLLSHVQQALPAATTGLCVGLNEPAVGAGTVNSVGCAEMGNVMHRIAMSVMAQTPHAYACNNPGMFDSLMYITGF